MENRLSRHARIRFRQRGIRDEVVDCLYRFGRMAPAPGGIERVYLGRRESRQAVRELKKVIRILEHAGDITILDGGECIITGYRKRKRYR
ncbi:MAG TPA: hypothetical protein ENK27_06595 [Desulfobulbus sp.]|nr:hypothetical protein [Desulfobulbus sp.]